MCGSAKRGSCDTILHILCVAFFLVDVHFGNDCRFQAKLGYVTVRGMNVIL